MALFTACTTRNDSHTDRQLEQADSRVNVSCPHPEPDLTAIDSLMWQRPGSALARLLPYFDTCRTDGARNASQDNIGGDCRYGVHTVSTAYNRHYAQLLLAELLYKKDYAQTTRPELLRAADYFDSLVRQAFPHKGDGGLPLPVTPKHLPNPLFWRKGLLRFAQPQSMASGWRVKGYFITNGCCLRCCLGAC